MNSSCGIGNCTSFDVSLAIFKVVLSLGTVFGNSLVIVAVIGDRELRRNPTNLLIISLAVADLIVGLIVMPLSAINELPNGWPLGPVACDLWRATDVLSATASILNLTMIALERHKATTPPSRGSSLLLPGGRHISLATCASMIGFVWLSSVCISYPAIAWWRLLAPYYPHHPCSCPFTTDPIYILSSSFISFYLPLIIMVILYIRIYRTAKDTLRCLKRGERIIDDPNNAANPPVRLRIHKGGGQLAHTNHNRSGSGLATLIANQHASSGSSSNRISHPLSGVVDICSGPLTSSSTVGTKLRKFALGKKISKFNTEQKAAKTLGFVMGTFILCWLPFFTCNVLSALLPWRFEPPKFGFRILPFVSWLGYLNSGMNPVIYAHSMQHFRMAFIKILCRNSYRRKITNSHNYTNHTHGTLSTKTSCS